MTDSNPDLNPKWHGCMPDASSSSLPSVLDVLYDCAVGRTTRGTTFMSNPITICWIAALYLVVIFALRAYVRKKRPKFPRARGFVVAAALHNVVLAAASAMMNVYVTRALLRVIREGDEMAGIFAVVCVPITKREGRGGGGEGLEEGMNMMMTVMNNNNHLSNELIFALRMFLISKVYELADTAILVLRGRPLSFLHVWHHASVMLSVWGWLQYDVALGAIGMWFNTFVHIFMYLYYAAVLFGVKIGNKTKLVITLSQIVQFITGFLFLIPFMLAHLLLPHGCRGVQGIVISAVINASYLALFVLFFRHTYTTPGQASRPRTRQRHKVS